MRICHLIYDDLANPWLGGGGAVRARQIYRRLAAAHEVTLVSGGFRGAAAEEYVDGIRILRTGAAATYGRSRLEYALRAPQVLAKLAWDVWVHEFSAFAPLRVPRRTRRRGVLLLYHLVGTHAVRKHPLVGPFAWLAERRVLAAYPRVITISASVRQAVLRRVGGQVPVECVDTGVDARYLELEPADEPFVLYLGRLDVHTKGLDLLVAAFDAVARCHPGIELVLAGRGGAAEAARLGRLVAASPARQRIRLEGAVNEDRKCDLLRRCRLFCMPSRYEGWGIAAIEAAAAGKAVVGTRVDGLRDAVVDGQTGLLVDAASVPALAAGLSRLLADPGARCRLGRQARQRARGFGWDQVAAAQLAAYERALAGSTAAPTGG